MGDRCTGNCCREFTLTGLGDTPEAILARLRSTESPRMRDGEQIADMVVPLRKIEAGTVFATGRVCETPPEGGGWLFTCRHFDAATANCAIYEMRPRMCRDFPYNKPCEHGDACGWDTGRAGGWPVRFYCDEPLPDEPGMVWRTVHLRVLQGAGDQEAAVCTPLPAVAPPDGV